MKFPTSVSQYDPCKAAHLEPWVAMTYVHPEALCNRRPRLSPPKVVQRHREQMLQLARRWDGAWRLALFPASEIPRDSRSVITAVLKDENFDRMILDRRARNCVEGQI
eukprot:5121972-Amphidinium_carterae.1